jgi:hypothetical protein
LSGSYKKLTFKDKALKHPDFHLLGGNLIKYPGGGTYYMDWASQEHFIVSSLVKAGFGGLAYKFRNEVLWNKNFS